MQSEEQRLIESLFSRLKQAESQSAPRDAAAERLIEQQLRQQPAAPYYMAQAILIQEAAMKKLSAQVNDLESRLAQAQQQQPARQSGGFYPGCSAAVSATQRPSSRRGTMRSNNSPTASSPIMRSNSLTASSPTARPRRAAAAFRRRAANGSGRGGRCSNGGYADQHVPPLSAAGNCEYY